MPDGGKLRVRGQGGPGDPPGDVMLTVRVQPHPTLERDGKRLRMRLPVTAFEAYGGGPIDVPTPWGTVVLKLPAGSQGGQTLRIRGKGVHGSKGEDGDLLVTLEIKLPTEIGDAELLKQLEKLQGDHSVRDDLEL
jgi:DnaJ-class molecular chaperone